MFNDYYNEGIISQAISDHFQEAEIIKFEMKEFLNRFDSSKLSPTSHKLCCLPITKKKARNEHTQSILTFARASKHKLLLQHVLNKRVVSFPTNDDDEKVTMMMMMMMLVSRWFFIPFFFLHLLQFLP